MDGFLLYFPSILFCLSGLQGWGMFGAPWKGHESVTGLSHRDRQQFAPMGNQNHQLTKSHWMHAFGLWEKGAAPGENPQNMRTYKLHTDRPRQKVESNSRPCWEASIYHCATSLSLFFFFSVTYSSRVHKPIADLRRAVPIFFIQSLLQTHDPILNVIETFATNKVEICKQQSATCTKKKIQNI